MGSHGRDCPVGQQRKPARPERQLGSLAIGATVQAALRQNRLCFAFQPVVCAATRQVDYFECLLRMRDEEGAIIAGGEFITTMEQLGLIGFIDRYTLEQTVHELATHSEIKLGLNVSTLTACDQAWLQCLISLLRNGPDVAPRLIVEITETAALCDLAQLARFVDTLRHAGCRVALDDFGAGYTSLRHLQILAIDTLKIDGFFVRTLAASPQNRIFLRHLLGLTNDFGFSTVAEGVENAEDAALVCAEGIGYLQGYHLGAPSIERTWLAAAAPGDRARPGAAAGAPASELQGPAAASGVIQPVS